jgi:hypothetical protein
MNLGGGDPGTKTTEIIDLSGVNPTWSNGPDMIAPRIELNAVLLPNGEIVAQGGSDDDEVPDEAAKTADLYNPVSNTFRSGGVASYSRLYHSTAVLLPDATVASFGGNSGDRGRYLGAIEIYTPPYLYDSNDELITTDRPQITSVNPGAIVYGSSFSVNYTSVSPITSAVLIRPGSATHAYDMDQRLVGLCGPSPQPACSGSGTLSLTAPPNGNIAPPGYYMLFLVDSSGVPSKAQWVQLTTFASSAPVATISSPATDTTITAGGSVSFDTPTVVSKYSWVFPGGTPATSTVKTPGSVTFSTAGTYLVSLTAIDASNNSDPSPPTRKITVLPSSGDFNISISQGSRTVTPGQSTTFTVNVTGLSGYNHTVDLTVDSEAGFPTGVSSGGFSPSTITGTGSSTLTMNTTTSALPYAVSLSIHGNQGSLEHTAATTLLINLAPPSNLTATPTNSQVALSWPSSVGATSYRVHRSLFAGGPYETISCPSGLSYTDLDVTNGTTYYYTVSSVFTGGPAAGGASAYSVEKSATPPCPAVPNYTGSMTVSKSGGDAVWTWTPGGSTAFDLVRGDLSTLRATDGNFTAALDALPVSEAACLANNTTALSLADPYGAPPPGEGVFAIVRPVSISCPSVGSYDEGGVQAGGRDAEIAASARACP